jgi:hypothetical protein
MKRIVILLCAFGVLSFACFGQDAFQAGQKGGTPPPVSKKLEKPLEVRGVVNMITQAEPSKGIRPEIIVYGEEGKIYIFLVRTTTTIYSPEWKAMTLDKLAKGRQVRVQYITNKEGSLVALSIKPVYK